MLGLGNTYCFSITTMFARTRLDVTSYVHCLSRFSREWACSLSLSVWGITHWKLWIVQCRDIACDLSWNFATQSEISFLVLVSCGRRSQRRCPVTLTLWSHASITNANCTLSLMSSDFIPGFGRSLKIWHFVFSGQPTGRSLSISFIIHAVVFFDRRML